MKKKAIIILGAGIMQIPSIKTSSGEGYAPLVFDGNPDPAGRKYAEAFFNIDIKDYKKIIDKCRELKEYYSIKGVFTAGTDFSYITALIAEEMNLPGISYKTALKATVKSEMRKAFDSFSVSSPKFITADNMFSSADLPDNISYPLVVKPVDSMGGRGAVKIMSPDNLEEAVKNALSYSRSGKAIIEEFIEGAEFSLDAVVEDGHITVCGIADRHIFFPPYFVEMGHTMPSIYPLEVQKKVIDVFKKGIKAIGIDNGAAKGDIKYNGEKAFAGEIAARLSGGYMSGWTFPYSTGLSVTKAAVNIAVGRPSRLGTYSYNKTAAERAFISIPGRVADIIIPDYLKDGNRAEEIKDVFINVEKGEKVVFPRNNVEKCGNIIASHKERDRAVNAAEKGCRDIIVRLESCNAKTEKFLYKSSGWIPDAFKLENKDNIKSFEKMQNANITGCSASFPKIAVKALPFPCKELSKDWLGRTFNKSVDKVLEITAAEYEKTDSSYDFVLGKIFWKAFLRGGVQGGIWIIDTFLQYLEKGELPQRFLK